MAFFTGRSELGKSPQTLLRTQGSAQEQMRKLVRDDFATRQRPADNDLAGYAVPPLQQAIAISLREIDGLIVKLRRRREELLGETARMQSEIIEYAKLNQSTIASTKIITERLANFNKVPAADSIREPTVENSNQEDREGSQTGSAGSTEDASAESSPDTQTKRTEDVIPTESFATGSHPAFPSEFQCRIKVAATGASTILGGRIVKVEPLPGSLSTVMSPPIIWQKVVTMDVPLPQRALERFQ